MGTNAYITVETDEDDFYTSYIHFDGYDVLDTLNKHYTDPELVKQLISLGAMSSLGPDIHSSEFYGRDRGERDTNPAYNDSFDEIRKNNRYHYIFTGDSWVDINEYSKVNKDAQLSEAANIRKILETIENSK